MEPTSPLLLRERDIEEPDVRTLFIPNLCKTLGDMRDLGYHVILGIDANNDLRDGSVSAALSNIGIKEAVMSNHRDESGKPIDSIWTSSDPNVLYMAFFLSTMCTNFTQIIT